MPTIAIYDRINKEIDEYLNKKNNKPSEKESETPVEPSEKESETSVFKEAFCNLALAYVLSDNTLREKIAKMAYLLHLKGYGAQTKGYGAQTKGCEAQTSD